MDESDTIKMHSVDERTRALQKQSNKSEGCECQCQNEPLWPNIYTSDTFLTFHCSAVPELTVASEQLDRGLDGSESPL